MPITAIENNKTAAARAIIASLDLVFMGLVYDHSAVFRGYTLSRADERKKAPDTAGAVCLAITRVRGADPSTPQARV